MTTDMGKANAAASVAAMLHSGLFDLRSSYFLVAGVGGIDSAQGTTGTAAWSRYLVDADLLLAARPVLRDISGNWARWQKGVLSN